MEKKPSFFSALKEEVIRGLSPSRSRAKSPARTASPFSILLRRKKNQYVAHAGIPQQFIARSGSFRPVGEALTPLVEGPDPDGCEIGDSKRISSGLGQWMKGQLSRTPSIASSVATKRSDLRLLLGVMGAPLAPVHVSTSDPLPHLSIKDTPIVSLSLFLFISHLCYSETFLFFPFSFLFSQVHLQWILNFIFVTLICLAHVLIFFPSLRFNEVFARRPSYLFLKLNGMAIGLQWEMERIFNLCFRWF